MRRNSAPTRSTLPDARYQSQTVTKLINGIMKSGKKSTAEGLVYGAFDRIEEISGRRGLDVFEIAVRNVTPTVEVKPRRVGGATYQVPMEVKVDRSQALAIRWIIDAARKRGGKNMKMKLYQEFLDAHENKGGAVKKREDTHKMADANKAFAHFRW